MTLDELFTVRQTSAELGISDTRVRQLGHPGGPLEARRVGRRVLITKTSVYRRRAAVGTPPGVQRALYRFRYLRDLTSFVPKPHLHFYTLSRREILNATAWRLFGTSGEARRLCLHRAALRGLEAGARRDWAGLEGATREVANVFDELRRAPRPPEDEAKRWFS